MILLLTLQTVYSQSIGDTVLYLLHESGNVGQGKGDTRQYYPEEKTDRIETEYDFHYPLYDGYPLFFITYKRELNTRTLSKRELKRLPVVTIDRLRGFIAANFPRYYGGYDSGAYFGKLKRIYIVECVNKRKTTVTEVVFNITRE